MYMEKTLKGYITLTMFDEHVFCVESVKEFHNINVLLRYLKNKYVRKFLLIDSVGSSQTSKQKYTSVQKHMKHLCMY